MANNSSESGLEQLQQRSSIQPSVINLDDLTHFLNAFFVQHQFAKDEPGGIYRPSSRPIQRLGLVLEPWANLSEWAIAERLDALFLHRPWMLQLDQLPADLGIIAYHLGFDERLTLGFNPRLAVALNLTNLEPMGEKAGRTIGMVGTVLPQQGDRSMSLRNRYYTQLADIFGGLESIQNPSEQPPSRVAVVGAMTDALVREAAQRGAELYITGQFRTPAEPAVQETGMSVAVVGHQRSEEWGLRALAGVLRDRWSHLTVVLPL
ncbi:Nif3-like dinuclear metal center hexameric protein [Oculatella sp. LEGE 06141]|uniref:Nif3-like dinuclear metal center hexameric protein n=1 Tax=Oculatella sp. LEGE 06141 TaxID=1828648 RepID=UPI001882F390|nr:Nif3-like dinuclear metal center hexameric protein [Oculatella sp. LEGE 06141]MBE9177523.1 Nif3-like dinuclear metal center hexameric protein [Oculatella sp. LEGE 06141]